MFGISFKNLKILDIITSKGGSYIYAQIPSTYIVYKFFFGRNNKVFGKIKSGWGELSSEATECIKKKLEEQKTKIPVYII